MFQQQCLYYTILLIILTGLSKSQNETPDCGPPISCPSTCKLEYRENGCPRNCRCQIAKKCPLVTCPAKDPICSVYTQLDRCQTCSCRVPYLVTDSGKNATKDYDFVFVDQKSLAKFRRSLEDNEVLDFGADVNDTLDGTSESETSSSCSLVDLVRIDKCLEKIVEYKDHLKKNVSAQLQYVLNPIVKTHPKDLPYLCQLYIEARECSGEEVLTECMSVHLKLSELDAILGYSCGKNREAFLVNLDCVQAVHKKSYRLALCEDSTNKALNYIDQHVVGREKQEKQRCSAIAWQLQCETSSLQKECSLEASQVNEESLLWAYRRQLKGCTNMDNTPSADLGKCTIEHRRALTRFFGELSTAVSRKVDKSKSAVYPSAYDFTKDEVVAMCQKYKTSPHFTPIDARRACINAHPGYTKAHFVLEYPCSLRTNRMFLKSFDCLHNIRTHSKYMECEVEASKHLDDPSNDPCETYTLFIECLADDAVEKCGQDAWETQFAYLSYQISNTVPNCFPQEIRREKVERESGTTTVETPKNTQRAVGRVARQLVILP